jgi:cell division protein FtsQ
LPWVKSATVERRLPDAIFVHLTERQPLALWQRNGKLALIDTEGVIVTTEHLDRYSSLLLVVGEEAPPHAQALIDILKTQPELMKRVNSAVRVADRRWNLQMDSGIAVELPEDNVADAWAHLAEIEKSHALLARDIQSVDLRLGDRVVVRAATPAKTEKNEQKGDGKAEPAKQAPAKQPPAKQTAKST